MRNKDYKYVKPVAPLTRRETQIAETLAWGASKKMAASRHSLSTRTVESTARNIYIKTGSRNNSQLSVWWLCKKFGIPESSNPLLSLLLLVLLVVYQLAADDTSYVRTLRGGRARVTNTVKRKK